MVRTNKNLYRSRAMAENSLGTHISLGPHLLRFTKFENCQMNSKPHFGFWLQLVWEVHNLKFIHQIVSYDQPCNSIINLLMTFAHYWCTNAITSSYIGIVTKRDAPI